MPRRAARRPRDGWTGHSTDRTAGHRADGACYRTDAGADSGAADPFFCGGAGCGRQAEERNESEFLHQNLPRQRNTDTRPLRTGPAVSAFVRAII
jgi:hypothetical protein